MTIKRATEYIYDHKTCLHTVKLEERHSNYYSLVEGMNKLNYFKAWLESLGDYRAYLLSYRIELYFKNFFKCEGYTGYLSEVLLHTNEKNTEKYYFNKLSDQTKNYITQRPYLYKKHHLKADVNHRDVNE